MGRYKRLKARANLLSHDAKLVKIKTEHNNSGAIKVGVFAFLVALQLAIALTLYYTVAMAFQWYFIIATALSLITCLYVLASDKSGHSKAVWIIFLLVGSSVSFIFYILSEEKLLFAKHRRRFKAVFAETEQYKPQSVDYSSAKTEVKNDINYLTESGKFPVFNNTDVKYYPSGASFFDDVLEDLKGAQKFVFMEFFIIADGVLLNRTLDILAQKVAGGVDVRLIYDDVGSRALPRKTKKRIKNLGIKLIPFNRLIPRFNVALNYRDHRKIIVIDGKTAYTGGVNLADEYVNEKRMYGYWKDNGVRLRGAAVDGICHIFLRQWQFLTKKQEDFTPYLNNFEKVENFSFVVPYGDGIDYPPPIGRNVYVNLISLAKEKLYIMTPYFVVDDAIATLLSVKASSGVDVRLLIPEVADKPYVYRVSRNNAEKLIESGVKVYCMKRSFVHAKTVYTENAVSVGSINMDYRSFFQQFEISVYTDDKTVMQAVEEDFLQIFNEGGLIEDDKILRKSLINRLASGLLQFFAPLM